MYEIPNIPANTPPIQIGIYPKIEMAIINTVAQSKPAVILSTIIIFYSA